MTEIHPSILNLELDLLRTFVAVADLNTFAAAAVAVCRTQSAISQQMQRLESVVGKKLFRRHGRNKLLTKEGSRLLAYARKILAFHDDVCQSLINDEITGSLSLGCCPMTVEHLSADILRQMALYYPGITLNIQVTDEVNLQRYLQNREIDLAVTASITSSPNATILRHSALIWMMAAHPVFEQYDSVPLIVLKELSTFDRMAISLLTQANLRWHVAYEATSYQVQHAACKAGLGIMMGTVENFTADLQKVAHLPPLPDMCYALIANASMRNPLAECLRDLLLKEFASSLSSQMICKPTEIRAELIQEAMV